MRYFARLPVFFILVFHFWGEEVFRILAVVRKTTPFPFLVEKTWDLTDRQFVTYCILGSHFRHGSMVSVE